MNPSGYPAEVVPLQGGRHGGLPGQPSAPMMVQHTTVDITTESTPDHIIWSLCCFVYSNPFCLGLAALIRSIKARDRKMIGDLEGAKRYGSAARRFNIASSILTAIMIVFCIYMYIKILNGEYPYR